jgi:ribosome-binding ATPase YchF (GTP1/OBG family)
VKAVDSIRDSELDSNEIDESDLQFSKHDEQRISKRAMKRKKLLITISKKCASLNIDFIIIIDK